MIIGLKEQLHSLLNLIYPSLCYSCRYVEPLISSNFCLSCLNTLPFVASAKDSKAALSGKDHFPKDIEFFQSLFYYTKEGNVAEMIHRIKYEGQYRTARYLGFLLGKELKGSKDWQEYRIVPVPIHIRRYRERGYNQAEEIAKGIATVLEIPIVPNGLKRTAYQASQTSKGKYSRSQILQSSFALKDPSLRKVLLVDDVVTTGSTINACFGALSKGSVQHVEVAALGISI